jgi:hypothetical protein
MPDYDVAEDEKILFMQFCALLIAIGGLLGTFIGYLIGKVL